MQTITVCTSLAEHVAIEMRAHTLSPMRLGSYNQDRPHAPSPHRRPKSIGDQQLV
jgi:hypothetical protein